MKDYFGYEGKTCVVTGAASGMGKAVCEILLDLGAEVIGLDVKQTDLPLKQFVTVNLGEKESIDAAFAQLPKKIDRFFGVAGVSGYHTGFNHTYTVNLISNKYITDFYLTDRMNEGGAIVYVASTAGVRWRTWKEMYSDIIEASSWEDAVKFLEAKGQTNGSIGYVASKRSIVQYSKQMMPAFAKKNIRVNTISPSVTNTPLLPDFQAQSRDPEFKHMLGIANRFAEAREMAEPLVFINSNMASYISGHDLIVDYGWNANIELNSEYGKEEDNYPLFPSFT